MAPEADANGDGEAREAVGSRFERWRVCSTLAATSSTIELETGLVTRTGGAVLGAGAGATAGANATAGPELVGTCGGAEDDEGRDIVVMLKDDQREQL